MKELWTEIRVAKTWYKPPIYKKLESSLYCVWLLGLLHFCVAEPAKPPLHKMHIYGKYATLMKLYKVQIWTMVPGLTPQWNTTKPGLWNMDWTVDWTMDWAFLYEMSYLTTIWFAARLKRAL